MCSPWLENRDVRSLCEDWLLSSHQNDIQRTGKLISFYLSVFCLLVPSTRPPLLPSPVFVYFLSSLHRIFIYFLSAIVLSTLTKWYIEWSNFLQMSPSSRITPVFLCDLPKKSKKKTIKPIAPNCLERDCSLVSFSNTSILLWDQRLKSYTNYRRQQSFSP